MACIHRFNIPQYSGFAAIVPENREAVTMRDDCHHLAYFWYSDDDAVAVRSICSHKPMNMVTRLLAHRMLFVVGAILLVLAMLSACGEPLRERSIEITATEMRFDPDRVEAHTGEQIFLRLRNRGQVAHSLTIELPAGDRTVSADPGVDAILAFRAPAPGEYRFYCRIPGHEAQQGVLVVLP